MRRCRVTAANQAGADLLPVAAGSRPGHFRTLRSHQKLPKKTASDEVAAHQHIPGSKAEPLIRTTTLLPSHRRKEPLARSNATDIFQDET